MSNTAVFQPSLSVQEGKKISASSILVNNKENRRFFTGKIDCLHENRLKFRFDTDAPISYKNTALQIGQKYFDSCKEFPEYYTPINYIAIPVNISKEELLSLNVNCCRLMEDLNEDIINPSKNNIIIREFLIEITSVSSKINTKFFPFFRLGFSRIDYDLLSNLIKHISLKIDNFYRVSHEKRKISKNALLSGNSFKILSLLPKLSYDVLDDLHNLNSNTSFNKEIENLLNQYFKKHTCCTKQQSVEKVLSEEDTFEIQKLLLQLP